MQHVWETGDLHTGFSVETCEKKPLGRPRHRWDVSIEMDLEK
jgi:hypothetical protein